jgi:hypothetical protein
MEQFVAKYAPRESTETIAPFLTIVGVDTTFLAVRAAIQQLVSCFSYYQPRCLTDD